jgi:hypothetical protein
VANDNVIRLDRPDREGSTAARPGAEGDWQDGKVRA